jgi:large subunit ribosomal protein L17
MRKRVFGRNLGRSRGARKALFRSLIRALVISGSIETTLAKAKAVRPEVEKIMTLVREGSLAARRRVLGKLGDDKETAKKLFKTYGSIAKKRKSGFVRLTELPPRSGDNARMAKLEWTEMPVVESKENRKVKLQKAVK